jgi:hypothetical protein
MRNGIAAGLFVGIVLALCSGCQTGGITLRGSEDIAKLRGDIAELDRRYTQLQSDYRRVVEENREYAEYYRTATEEIAKGLGDLQSGGIGMAEKAAILTGNNELLTSLLRRLIELQSGKGEGKLFSSDTESEAD